MGTTLIEKLADGSEHQNYFADDEMAKVILKTRGDRFRKAKKSELKPKETNKPEPQIPEDKPIETVQKSHTKFTLEQLNELGKGSGGRQRLVAMAKKFEVSAGGKNDAIAQRIFNKALENSAKAKSDAE